MTIPGIDSNSATEKVAGYLTMLIARTGLHLEFDIQSAGEKAAHDPDEAGEAPAAAAVISVEFSGPDTSLLTARNGELLHSIEHIAAKILCLEPEDHHRISFDAEGFKAGRDRELKRVAKEAIEQVRASGLPFAFAPMNSRERRMLHLALDGSGLPTASSGDGPRRFVVLYPANLSQQPLPSASKQTPGTGLRTISDNARERTEAIRNRFRRR